jgi:uncharacterized membrane protein YedE/YeeE
VRLAVAEPVTGTRTEHTVSSHMTFDVLQPVLGGLLIGGSAALLLLTHGQIAGISGIARRALLPAPGARGGFRYAFLFGLLSGGVALGALWPQRFDTRGTLAWPLLLLAGLLIGVGTSMAGGCTSGHGVCGIGRGSRRSIAATLTFMCMGALALLVVRRLS